MDSVPGQFWILGPLTLELKTDSVDSSLGFDITSSCGDIYEFEMEEITTILLRGSWLSILACYPMDILLNL